MKVLISNTGNDKTLTADLQSNVVNEKSRSNEVFIKFITTPSDNLEIMVHRMPSSAIIPDGKPKKLSYQKV